MKTRAPRTALASVMLTICILGNAAADPKQKAPPGDNDTPTANEPAQSNSEMDAALLEAAEIDQDAKTVEVIERLTPGADTVLGADILERYEQDDIHKVLTAVPGVYFREEDGYGLRPNIGMRGSDPERSAKVALMEDGILIAPAPYSAPAAYYFPLVTRMRSVEVLKGPGAIIYGPNTVGGSVNLLSQDIPSKSSGYIDIAGGSNLYGKAHARYGASSEYFGFLLEGAKLRSDGFKRLDNGGDTGFDKNDVALKLRANTSRSSEYLNTFELKVGISNERSNETYTGLSVADFARTPYRRYAATQLDRMTWDHMRWQLSHKLEVRSDFDITTTVYRNSFARIWRRLDRFGDGTTGIRTVLDNPTAGNNPIFMQILRGEADSTSLNTALELATNDREFYSQGIQSVGHSEIEWLGFSHSADVGVRFHTDEAIRFHTADAYFMMQGALVNSDVSSVTRDASGKAQALALFAADAATIGRLTTTIGMRAEFIFTDYTDRQDPAQDNSTNASVLIPGAGAYYQLTDWLGVLGGVHRGFVPVAPGPNAGIDPELAVNYEAGVRTDRFGVKSEIIGFANDYKNLKGTCSASSGCAASMVGDEFNGGRVLTTGVESLITAEPQLSPEVSVPLRANYTFTRARFRDSFPSNNPQWGDVEEGDHLPYLPSHQLSLQGSVRYTAWEVSVAGRFQSAVRDTAGQSADDLRVPRYYSVDLAAHAFFGDYGQAYLTVDNVTGRDNIVSYRPFGARPGKPRLVVVGYKASF